ncbi:MAG: Eco57I restriction-modification methylase domain-containing protein [Armatimonadetes bacterium]|nr:Eco57I restriction-modification methylase domain-containing protein [Armatimonadota bacterium]
MDTQALWHAGLDGDSGTGFLQQVDRIRSESSRTLNPTRKAAMGQFFTPVPVARLMASMLECRAREVRILDAGAGIGSLTAACVAELCCRPAKPARVCVSAYELDEHLLARLHRVLGMCEAECRRNGIAFRADVFREDFIGAAARAVQPALFSGDGCGSFTCAILNPPYRKVHSASATRARIRDLGIETSNLYAGFVAAAVRLLQPRGELVVISPRSFCNGPYFRAFRRAFLADMTIRRLHLFEARDRAFRDDGVLQENVVICAAKDAAKRQAVVVTVDRGDRGAPYDCRTVPWEQVVRPDDPDLFIHIPSGGRDDGGALAALLRTSLGELGIQVSTGRVVDFRAKEFLRREAVPGTVPLIYPAHFVDGYVAWPQPNIRKPTAIAAVERTVQLLVPNSHYVVVKRFTSKEQVKRVVAAVHDPERIPHDLVGFENHVNYFHRYGRGLDPREARGLAAFLNTTWVDAYFRQFNGHTQVNAADLRYLAYPTEEQLVEIGASVPVRFPCQEEIDRLVEKVLLSDE